MLLARRGRLSGERQQRPGETVGLAAQLANAMCAGQRGGMQENTAGSWKAHAIRSEKNVYFTLPGFRVAITSGSTMKKLKMPMYTPVCSAGNEPASTEYGMASVLAQAIPTPVIDSSKRFLSWISATDINPSAPQNRHRLCTCLRPTSLASFGRKNENTKHTSEYIPKQMPPHSTPRV